MGKITRYLQTKVWNDARPSVARLPILAALSGLAAVYKGVQKLHSRAYRSGWLPVRTLPCTVISIGNLSAGGTGKTPMTAYVARLCRRNGYAAVVLSRGYRGRAEHSGGVVSDGRTVLMTPETAGDEPFMLATALDGIPVIVGSSRYRSGQLALDRFRPDVLILDDGFQHLKLKKNLNILLLDGRRPFGNGRLLPRGILREPPAAVRRADAVVLTRTDSAGGISDDAGAGAGDKPVFHAVHQPWIVGRLPAGERPEAVDIGGGRGPADPEIFSRRRVFAFSGIARNASFRQGIRQMSGKIVGHRDFPDHFAYQEGDLAAVGRAALTAGADCLATTAKDFVRLRHRSALPLELVVVDVRMAFADDRFDTFLTDQLARIVQVPKRS